MQHLLWKNVNLLRTIKLVEYHETSPYIFDNLSKILSEITIKS